MCLYQILYEKNNRIAMQIMGLTFPLDRNHVMMKKIE